MEDALTADDLAGQLTDAPDAEQLETDPQNEGEEDQEGQQEEDQTEETEGEQPEGDGEEIEAAEEQPERPDSAEVFLEWEQNGEKVRVSQDELKAGYVRAQSLETEIKAVQQRAQQEFQTVQQLAGDFGQLANIDAQLQQYQQVDWRSLQQQDPLAYSTHLAEMNNLRALRDDVVRGIEGKRGQFAQQQAEAFQKQSMEAQEHLKKVVPNFGDATIKEMKTYGEKLGFTAQELAQVADKRMLQVLYEASQWRALQDKKPALQNKVKALPTKATKPTGQQAPAKQVQIDKQVKRLAQTRSANDFATLLNLTSR